jgi:hypothetical protein
MEAATGLTDVVLSAQEWRVVSGRARPQSHRWAPGGNTLRPTSARPGEATFTLTTRPTPKQQQYARVGDAKQIGDSDCASWRRSSSILALTRGRRRMCFALLWMLAFVIAFIA